MINLKRLGLFGVIVGISMVFQSNCSPFSNAQDIAVSTTSAIGYFAKGDRKGALEDINKALKAIDAIKNEITDKYSLNLAESYLSKAATELKAEKPDAAFLQLKAGVAFVYSFILDLNLSKEPKERITDKQEQAIEYLMGQYLTGAGVAPAKDATSRMAAEFAKSYAKIFTKE